MATPIDAGPVIEGSLKDASLDRLVCLQRHWMWADEAMARFDRELAEERPRVVDLIRGGETLLRLRRVHLAFGEALRKEHLSREIDSLDP